MIADSEATGGIELATTDPQTSIDGEGYIYDIATGEVLGRIDLVDRWEVDSAEAAEWALELRSKIEGHLAGIDARRRALVAQLDALRREQERRLNWWDVRFRSSLVEFARSQLTGKARTARFAWGSVAFRKRQGTNEIVDMAAAVEWAKEWAPEAVKVSERVGVKDVLAARELALRLSVEPVALPFLVSTGPSETAEIDTGVGAAKGGAQ